MIVLVCPFCPYFPCESIYLSSAANWIRKYSWGYMPKSVLWIHSMETVILPNHRKAAIEILANHMRQFLSSRRLLEETVRDSEQYAYFRAQNVREYRLIVGEFIKDIPRPVQLSLQWQLGLRGLRARLWSLALFSGIAPSGQVSAFSFFFLMTLS